MFNPVQVVIDAFVDRLQEGYVNVYSNMEPAYPGVIAFVGRMALENIANADAAYHDVTHTVMVTSVGQEILRGKHLREGGVSAQDWLHFVISLLCHDIGYIRGVLSGDKEGEYVIDDKGGTVKLEPGATDASLTPYHIDRGKIYVRERFGNSPLIDADRIAANIERTRFPIPDDSDHKGVDDDAGLLRAADLIGQLADPDYMRKISALFHEFQETGTAEKMGCATPADLQATYPKFFWTAVEPYIGPAVRYLQATQEGKQWLANLYSHVFREEHGLRGVGPERGPR